MRYRFIKLFERFNSILILSAFFSCSESQTDTANQGESTATEIFQKGQKIISENFNGEVWLHRYVSASDSLDCIVSLVSFQAGARTNWHMHPGGQVLMVIKGTGYYQEKGATRQIIHKGDVVKCPPGTIHWHGAVPDSEFSHLVVAPDVEKGEAKWLREVTEAEYAGLE